MDKPTALRTATPEEAADALSFGLRYYARRRVRHADELSARIAADRLAAPRGLRLRGHAQGLCTGADLVGDADTGRQAMNAVADQVINAEVAQSLSADVARDHGLAAWVVVRDQPTPGAFTARLVTDEPTPYVLQADTLEELRAQLPAGLTHSGPQPADPSDLVEIWFLTSRVEAGQGTHQERHWEWA